MLSLHIETVFTELLFRIMSQVNVIFSDIPDDVVTLLKKYPAVFVVADRRVKDIVTDTLVEHCAESGVAVRGLLNIVAAERLKTFETVGRIQRWLIDSGADRDALVLAVGGGITTDLAGFAAATFKRGVRYANVPTTLLAMVDASIGGKTGCNVASYKNMCGAFLQPEFTFICTPFVRSLPWREFSSGCAEMLKTFIIGDGGAYAKAVRLLGGDSAPFNADAFIASLSPLVRRAVEIKTAIVERDFKEKGERRMLNLGHTFAHAIETRSARCLVRRTVPGEAALPFTFRRVSHGHAVAMGLILAARMSEREGIAPSGLAGRLVADLSRIGLPVDCPWDEAELMSYIRADKKARNGRIPFILMEDIGKVVVCEKDIE